MKQSIWLALLMLACGCAAARGIEFSEEMHGYAYYQEAFRPAHVQLHVTITDIDAWRTNPAYAAVVSGTAYLEQLAPQSVTGSLQILTPFPGIDGRLLVYRLRSATLQYTGVKHVRDSAGAEVIDQMTNLRGLWQPLGQTAPSIADLVSGSKWSSELYFEWWDPSVVWDFSSSFRTIQTPWYDELEVIALFVTTVLGALASTLFPWLF